MCPPVLGPESRVSDVSQLRAGLNVVAVLGGKLASTNTPQLHDTASMRNSSRAKSKPRAKHSVASGGSAAGSPRTLRSQGKVTVKSKSGRKAQPLMVKGIAHPSMQNITQCDVRRLLRRAGCKRIAKPTYNEVRKALAAYLGKVVGDSTVYADYAKRKTVSIADVITSLKR